MACEFKPPKKYGRAPNMWPTSLLLDARDDSQGQCIIQTVNETFINIF